MPQDLDLLQGSWNITALEMDGQKVPSAMLTGANIAIQGNRFTTTGMGAVYAGTLELDPSPSPRQLDMKFDAGPEKGNTNRGIYELDGDTLRICLATRGNVRPSSFATSSGTGFALETLARHSSVAVTNLTASPAETRAPATEFEGEWSMMSGIMNGKAMEQHVVQWVKRVTRGNRTTVYAGPQVMLKVEFTSDSSKSPKAIDYVNLVGPNRVRLSMAFTNSKGMC